MQNSLSNQIHQLAVWGLPIKSYECWKFFFLSHLRAFCRGKCCSLAARTQKVGLVLWGLLKGILCSGPETLATQSLWWRLLFLRTLGKLRVHNRFLVDWITPTLQTTKNINLKHESITFCKMCLEGPPPFLICPLFSSATNMKRLVDMTPWTHTDGTRCLISTTKWGEFN